MSSFEFGPCSVFEYEKDAPNRIREPHLEAKEDPYTLMLLLGKRAFMQPVDFWEAEEQESGLYLVSFDVLNQNMDPIREDVEVLFGDGYLQKQRAGAMPSYSLGGRAHTVETGYFRNARQVSSGPDDQAIIADEVERGLEQLLEHANSQELVIAR